MTPLLSFITGAAIAAACLAIARRRKRCLMLLTDAGTSLVMSLHLAQAAERRAKARSMRVACTVLPPATQDLPAWGETGRWWEPRRIKPLSPHAK